MKQLTEKQLAIFNYIKEFIAENGYSPIAKEIQEEFGYASQNAAIEHLLLIEKKRYIRRTPKIARSIVVLQE